MKFSLAFTVLKQLTVGVVAVSVATWLTIGTALAWVNPTAPLSDQSSAINFWNNCGTTNKEIWAQDGDVLTTTKWNQALCTYFFNFAMWGDWPRGKTPATWSNGHIGAAENTINGQKGTYLEVLLLASPGGGGGVNFYDANRQFPTQPDGRSNVLGSVQYHRPGQPGFETSKEGLHLLSANGPVWIDTCIGTTVNPYCDDTINAGRPTDSPNQYPIGWVSVNLYDTADFDIQCQYRVHETLVWGGESWYRHPVWVKGTELGFVATTAGGTYGNAAGWSISKNNKTTWIPPASGVSPPGTINRIEKLCLPRYVDGQNMNQTFF